MATTRRDLRAYIFSAINIGSILSITGSAVAGNERIYSGWPNIQPILSGVEPSEGWVSFHELTSLKVFGGSNIEDHTIQFNLWNTLQSSNDLLVDLLDTLFDLPTADQVGYTITSDWVCLLSQRVLTIDQYEDNVKLYRKICNYVFRTTKVPYRVGP
jgi:hypothetical protein